MLPILLAILAFSPATVVQREIVRENGSLVQRCRGRDRACNSNGRPLARYLSLSSPNPAFGITFTRSGVGAACTAADGGVTFPADGQPCVTGTGLHMRPSISNLAGTAPNDPSNAFWTKTSATVDCSSPATAPDGTASACKVTPSGTSGRIVHVFTSTGTAMSWAVYAKAVTGTQTAQVVVRDETTSTTLQTKTCSLTTAWPVRPDLRCIASASSTTSGDSISVQFYPDSVGGTAAAYVWGMQPEPSAFADAFCNQATCNAETATVPKPSGMSLTEGCAKVCVTPTWTGANPGGTIYLFSSSSGNPRFLYEAAGLASMQAFDGTHTPGVAGSLTAGSRSCFLAQWSASGNSLKVTNLTTSTVGTASAFTGFSAFDAVFGIGNASSNGQPLGAGIDTIVLGSGVNSCQ